MGNIEEFAEDPYYGEEDIEGGPDYSTDEEQLVIEEPDMMTLKDLREIRNGEYESDTEDLYGEIENMGNIEEFAEDPYYGEEDIEGGPDYSTDEEQLVIEEPDMMTLKDLREIRNGEYESDAEGMYAEEEEEEELMDMGVGDESDEPREVNDAELRSFSSYQCKDLQPHCPDWASNGQCENHPSYMHQYCKESCGKCSHTPLPPTVIKYHKHEGKACRANQNGSDVEGQDFVEHVYTSEEQCKQKCTNDSQCQAFEWSPYNHGSCDIWYSKPVEFEKVLSFNCHVKVGSSN